MVGSSQSEVILHSDNGRDTATWCSMHVAGGARLYCNLNLLLHSFYYIMYYYCVIWYSAVVDGSGFLKTFLFV